MGLNFGLKIIIQLASIQNWEKEEQHFFQSYLFQIRIINGGETNGKITEIRKA